MRSNSGMADAAKVMNQVEFVGFGQIREAQLAAVGVTRGDSFSLNW
jgi:hypothetical protein